MTRSLLPREHGAYAQLAVPLATALIAARPTPAAGLFAAAACAAFLANEPLLVVLGHRGPRARRRDGQRAIVRLRVLAAIAIATACGALCLASGAARLAAGLAAALGLALVAVGWTRRQHSLVGELVATVALPAAALPAAVASSQAAAGACARSAAWSLGFACSVVAVQRVIARHRRPATRLDRAIVGGLAAIALGTVAVARREPAIVVAIPLVIASLAVAIWTPPATRLRAIGVALVAAALLGGGLALWR